MTGKRKIKPVQIAGQKCKGFWNGRGLRQVQIITGGLVNQTGATQYDRRRKKDLQTGIL